jgi:hypothetical protein
MAGLGRLNVILVTFDSLSAKNMSLYGYRRNTTPFIDSFADESCVFEHMQANSNSTLPSLASIFSGRYPLHHGYDRFSYLLAGGNKAGDLDQVCSRARAIGPRASSGRAPDMCGSIRSGEPAAAGGAR